MSPWGWRFIAETCRFHVYGWFFILYKLCAFVGVCGLPQSQCTKRVTLNYLVALFSCNRGVWHHISAFLCTLNTDFHRHSRGNEIATNSASNFRAEAESCPGIQTYARRRLSPRQDCSALRRSVRFLVCTTTDAEICHGLCLSTALPACQCERCLINAWHDSSLKATYMLATLGRHLIIYKLNLMSIKCKQQYCLLNGNNFEANIYILSHTLSSVEGKVLPRTGHGGPEGE